MVENKFDDLQLVHLLNVRLVSFNMGNTVVILVDYLGLEKQDFFVCLLHHLLCNVLSRFAFCRCLPEESNLLECNKSKLPSTLGSHFYRG